MYVAVVAIILGQSLLLGNVLLIGYALVVWLAFHIFVLVYEERTSQTVWGIISGISVPSQTLVATPAGMAKCRCGVEIECRLTKRCRRTKAICHAFCIGKSHASLPLPLSLVVEAVEKPAYPARLTH